MLGLLLAMTMLFPEMPPTDLAAALGVESIAVGFAHKHVFENVIGGVLALSRGAWRQQSSYLPPMGAHRSRRLDGCSELPAAVAGSTAAQAP